MNMRTSVRFILAFILSALSGSMTAQVVECPDSLIGRPFKAFDYSAYCSYEDFHPTSYLTDNNWDILCVFRVPGTVAKLDSLGIKASKSQLRLLDVGGLLIVEDGLYKTTMPILDKAQTLALRTDSKQFVDSIYPILLPKFKSYIKEINKKWENHAYSLTFSYLLDNYIFGTGKIPKPVELSTHPTWNGIFWALYEPRATAKIGTNGYGPLKVNWTDDLGYWPRDSYLISFAKAVIASKGKKLTDASEIEKFRSWNLVKADGSINIPVLHPGNVDTIDMLCDEITRALALAARNHVSAKYHDLSVSNDEMLVMFYHEVMWDLLEKLEQTHLIEKPDILKGKEVGKEHIVDISFIVMNH